MVEHIFIDGVQFEMGENSGVELVFQSPYFTDLDSIVSNRTNSVSLPLTLSNRRAIEMAQITASDYPYRTHSVEYYRDGLLMFKGRAELVNITATEVTFSFVWGNADTFGPLFDTKLSALQDDPNIATRYVAWGNGNAIKYYPEELQFGIRGAQYKHPTIPVDDIMQAIETHSGVSGLAGVFSDYAIPLLTKKTDRTANIAQATHIIQGYILRTNGANGKINGYLELTSNDADLPQIALSGGLFDVADKGTLTIANKAPFSYVVEFDNNRFNVSGDIVIEATDEDGNNPQTLATIPTTYTDNAAGTARTFTLAPTEVEVNVSGKSYVRVRLFSIISYEGGVSSRITTTANDLYLVLDADQEQEAIYNTTANTIEQFPIFLNLPDWSVGQLIKNLMKITGLFAYNQSANRVSFVRLSDLYAKRLYPTNWSGRLLGKVEDVAFSFGDMAQQNTLKYAEDSTIKGNYDGVISVRNFNLPSEAELLSVDFAATDMILVNGRKWANIPLYAYEYDNEGNRSVVYESGLTPRVLRYYTNSDDRTAVTFESLSFATLVETVYSLYQSIVHTPRVLTARLYVPSLELARLSLTTPCYIAELGHYYAIISLTTDGDNTATAELLEM